MKISIIRQGKLKDTGKFIFRKTSRKMNRSSRDVSKGGEEFLAE